MFAHPASAPAASLGPADLSAERLLPSRLRLLCVSRTEPSWSVLALNLAQYGCAEPQFRWCAAAGAALTLLREGQFDCLLIALQPEADDAPASPWLSPFLAAVRTSGFEEPIVLLGGPEMDDRLVVDAAAECEILLSAALWQSQALPLWIQRALQRTEAARDSRMLSHADRRRMVRERDESSQILHQQRQLVERTDDSSTIDPPGSGDALTRRSDVEQHIRGYYQELLRTYVIMGSGSLHDEIDKLARALAAADISPRDVMRLHLEQLEQLALGLGSRSSRHVMSRADLLAIEVLLRIGEFYRRKTYARGLGDFGIDLMHDDSLRQKRSAGK